MNERVTEVKPEGVENINIPILINDLESTIEGEVRFDDGSRALYAMDGSNYRQEPIGAVIPKNENDIREIVRICHKHDAPLLCRGGGTSLGGQCCNVAVVMDMSKYYNNILNLDADNKLITIQPGIVLDEMRGYTKEKAGLTFGPDPSTHNRCVLGGILGNNSCGVHSVMAANEGNGARVSDNTESLTVLTYDGVKMDVGPTSDEELGTIIQKGGRKGEIYEQLRDLRDKYSDEIRDKYPDIPRRVSGYNLDELLPENGFNVARALVGTEGTCVTILEATMKLLHNPPARTLVVLGYDDVYSAGKHVTEIMKYKPVGLEGIDHHLTDAMKKEGLDTDDLPLLPHGGGWLMVEFGGESREDADGRAKEFINDLKEDDDAPNISLFDDKEQEDKLWEIREAGLGATAFIPNKPDAWPGWEDAAIHPDNVSEYLKDFRDLLHEFDYEAALYGHYGQGCIHCRIDFDLKSEEGIENYKQFTDKAADLALSYGGSLSGEHGDGQARSDLLEKMYGKKLLQAFREFKAIWDPKGKMNPHNIVEPYGRTENLRLGADYSEPDVETHFQFPNEGSFPRAAMRCVGVGKCRRHEGGTMCPSYMVTREEKHSTRGRAHLLYEMFQGEIVKGSWKDESVKEALDLCLSCKGCKSDCPVHVDMATYKSEFLSHYFEGKIRPRPAYSFGLVYWWSRLASKMPKTVNFLTHTPGISNLGKLIGGIAQPRTIPRFADQPFKKQFKQNGFDHNTGKPKVILWPDTFNNYIKPKTMIAGAEVLQEAGFNVTLPNRPLCCGRPLYDFGFLDKAKELLHQIMHALKDDIRSGVPIVGVEPSCIAVFRDELHNLFPNDDLANRLMEQTFTLAEFLKNEVDDYKVPQLKRKAILHGHCHHKAIMKLDAEEELLNDMGLDVNKLTSGCCGMAGYFGYVEGEQYEVGLQAGERVLLPAVREADNETLIIADGFSCREQIEQETDRLGFHTAQILQMALRKEGRIN
jgi:FAD/FMN-containing dehydrogenase/Fe-S oxidoreductase